MNIFRFYCLCTFIALLNWSGVASAQIVEIPDTNLQNAVRQALTLPDGSPITQADMLSLVELEIWRESPIPIEKQITDITGLQHAINLRSLILPRNNISDLTPLANLNNLDRIGLWGNPISDISPIAGLVQLQFLDLGGCQVSDIRPIANLTNLTYLTLHYNFRIVDIAPLESLTQLTELRLAHNQIVDISPLANLSRLEVLTIFGNRITDYSPLELLSLTRLEYDESCEIPPLPVKNRMENRSFPSVFQAWPEKGAREALTPYHDLYWHGMPFGLQSLTTSEGQMLTGNIERAKA